MPQFFQDIFVAAWQAFMNCLQSAMVGFFLSWAMRMSVTRKLFAIIMLFSNPGCFSSHSAFVGF